MKIRLISVLCAVMLVLTFTGCEFPWVAEPTDPTHAARPSALEFVDGKEAESGKPQLSQMEVSEPWRPWSLTASAWMTAPMRKGQSGKIKD